MRNLHLLASASCVAIVIAGQAAAQTASEPKPGKTADSSAATGSEVVVTAGRRSENITKVPTAISAYSGAKLRDAQINSASDLAAITPNVEIKAYSVNANITIRGVGNGNFTQAGGDPGVAAMADGVYLGQPRLELSTFLDVNRVEVLRGPQGTLFGRNATGGAINIIPNTPTPQLHYGFDVSAGADPTMVHSTGYVSGPLNSSGTLLGRISAEQNYNQGFTRNLAPSGPSRLDGIDNGAVRGQLEWRPTDNFDARLLVEYNTEADAGPGYYLLGVPNNAGAISNSPIFLPYFSGGGLTLPPGPEGNANSRQNYAYEGSDRLTGKTVNLTTDWGVGGGHLKTLLSYNSADIADTFDVDGASATVNVGGTPTNYSYSTQINHAHQLYEEMTYASDGSKVFNYVVGETYYYEHLNQFFIVPTIGQGPPPFHTGGDIDTTSYAGFVHAQYAFTPSTKLFAGARYTHDNKSIDEFLIFEPVVAVTGNHNQASWSNISYEVGGSQEFGRSVTGYIKYATGYKGGGFTVGSLGPAFQPETDKNIEAGLKGVYFDGALQANLAVFHTDYNNLQVNQIIGPTSIVTNAARATIDGVEVETVIHPTDHFRIEANGAWLNARFDSYMTADSARPALPTLNLAGNLLPDAPHFNASIGVFDDVPIDSGTITIGGRFNWKSQIYFSQFNIPIASQNPVGKLDLHINYRSQDNRWTAGLFALNVTDVEVKSNVTVISALLGSLATATYEPGRQVGVSVGYHF